MTIMTVEREEYERLEAELTAAQQKISTLKHALEANTAQGVAVERQLAEARAALRFVNEQIGWKGSGPRDTLEYYCEQCSSEPAADWVDIQHEDHCLVLKVRQALTTAKEQDDG